MQIIQVIPVSGDVRLNTTHSTGLSVHAWALVDTTDGREVRPLIADAGTAALAVFTQDDSFAGYDV